MVSTEIIFYDKLVRCENKPRNKSPTENVTTDLEAYKLSLHHNAMIHCLLCGIIEASGLKHTNKSDGSEDSLDQTMHIGGLDIVIYNKCPCFGKFDLGGNGDLWVKIYGLDLLLEPDLANFQWEVSESPFENEKDMFSTKWSDSLRGPRRLFWIQHFEGIACRSQRIVKGEKLDTSEVVDLIKSVLDFVRKNPESDE